MKKIMRIYKSDDGYSFEYALNRKIDVRVMVKNNGEVNVTHYRDNDQFDIIPSAKEKEEWFQKVESVRIKRLSVNSYLIELNELFDRIYLVKEKMLSILDPDEDSDIISAIENGKTIEEIQNILDR